MKPNHLLRLACLAICLAILCGAQQTMAQGTWSPASSSGFTARAGLTATALNGKIYVVGGFKMGDFSFPDMVDIYDPTTDTWSSSQTARFVERTDHTASAINGKIYIIGGWRHISEHVGMDTMQVFDPLSLTWSGIATIGSRQAGAGFGSAAVGSKIYLIGGWNGSNDFDIVQVFDPATNTWSIPTTTGTFTPRQGLACAEVSGKIYAIGGSTLDGQVLGTLEVFDPANNTWTTPQTTGTFTPRASCTASVLDGKIYVIGGATKTRSDDDVVEVFDPATNAWSTPTTTGTFTGRNGLASAVVNGKIYAMGGVNELGVTLGTNEVFAPGPLSVGRPAKVHSFAVYPNPTAGIITMSGLPRNPTSLIIENPLGVRVMEIANPQSINDAIDLSALPAGCYFARVLADGVISTIKIVRQ